ncbi:MAG: PEP-utilizing protein mobile region [Myxococcales bacterium]|nr:PEP-utilizing protein mobile region [Myxococcales bacterium]
MFVHDLRDADASCGGKAVGLARLLVAGLTVPRGFVLDDGAFRHIAGELELDNPSTIGHILGVVAERIANTPIPPELEAEVRERARGLGTLLVVRSSATIEDGAAGAAAGVFSSQRAVPIEDVWDAIRAVWTSALTPLAAAYARRRGGIAIGVVVQEFIEGERVTVYTRPPGDPDKDELLVQRSYGAIEQTAAILATAAAGEPIEASARPIERYTRARLPAEVSTHQLVVQALRAEQAIGAHAGADVELVQHWNEHRDEVETWVVQARPIVHPTRRQLSPPPPIVLAPLQDGRIWSWDIAHNPDPLSPAQAGLVERVEQAQLGTHSLRVCGGFLYTSPRAQPATREVTSDRELAAHAAQLEAELDRVLAEPPPSVSDAIARYLAFYRIWAGELGPLISAARAVLPRALRAAGRTDADAIAARLSGHRPSAVEVVLASAARGELEEREVVAQLGALSPAWDVAVPTFGERPGLLRDAIARATAAQQVARVVPDPDASAKGRVQAASDPLEAQLRIARRAADLAERDDAYFARAQLMVRRALLARGAVLGLRDDDVFWLPLEALDAALDPDDAHRRAAAARAAAHRAAEWQMPVVVGGSPTPHGEALHGIGTGPRVTGRVVRFASLASALAVGSGDVVVTRAVTPALAVLVIGCAALVSETGGLLDHGAALARELGITCVVGCRDAWSRLDDGMRVHVDGAAGTVELG